MLHHERILFKLLSDQIGRKIASKDLKNEKVACFKTIFEQARKQLSETFEKKFSSDGEREELSAYLIWLLNKLFWVALQDDEMNASKENIELQHLIFTKSFLKQRWIFGKLFTVYIEVLQKVINADFADHCNGTDISFKPSEDVLKTCRIKLEYQSIVVQNESEAGNIIQICLRTCIRSAQLYCNVYEEQGILIRNAAFDVLRKTSLITKSFALLFLTEYLEHRSLTDEDTQFFISVMKTMSIIFKDLPSLIQYHRAFDMFKKTSLEMFKKVPLKRMKFNNQEILRSFVVSVSEILLYQFKNNEVQRFAIVGVAEMLEKVLDEFEYSHESVESLGYLVQLENSSILNLMKYVVIAELEQAPIFKLNVVQTSSTWQHIHKLLLTKIKDLPSENSEMFSRQLRRIAGIFILALQIDFNFTRRHQIRHGLHPRTCFCSSVNFDESIEPQMVFKDWNYKHVSLIMFEGLEKLTESLIEIIKARATIDSANTGCIFDIFSSIVKFTVNSPMIETLKNIVMAVVASPFNNALKNHQVYSQQTGYQKVMSMLPLNIKTFFEKPMLEEYQKQFQVASIAVLSTLEISRMGLSCWSLIESIVQYVTSQANKRMKEVLCNHLTNFCVNNSDKFSFFLEIYQKLLADESIGIASLEPLSDILCLTGGNSMAIKLLRNEHAFSYFIVCNDCQVALTDWSKDSRCDELHRRMAYLKEAKGVLVSSDKFAEKQLSLKHDAVVMFTRPKDFIVRLIPNIPSLLSHSSKTTLWIKSDKGNAFFKSIFIKDEAVLLVLKENLKDIIGNIQEGDFGNDLEAVLNNCLVQIAEIVKWTAYGNDKNLQSITINLVFTFATNVIDENVMVKCLKMFTYYIVQTNSQVIDEASLFCLEVAKRYGETLIQLFNWYKTFIMRHVFNLMLTNLFSYKNSLLDSMINFIKRLNFPRLRDFLPTTIDIIIAIALPVAVQKEKVMVSLEALCQEGAGISLEEAIEANFVKIYQEIYMSHYEKSHHALYKKCLEFIETKTGKTIKALLVVMTKKTVEEVLSSYNKSPGFVMAVMSQILDKGPDITERTANNIKERFLGVLIYFEAKLTSNECERVTKKNILLSLGGIIRLLTADRVSGFCFKIIAVLKVAMEQTSIDLSKTCIEIWKILILNCEVTSLGPILSTIFVSLEAFIEKYPNEVNEIYLYLVQDNSSLLSCFMSDLFFIEKTKIDDGIKVIIMQQIESQKMRDESTFKSSLGSLTRHMTSENSDLKVRIYCLQYLKELLSNNRKDLNEMICSEMTMDPVVDDLLNILISNCKNTSSKDLQLALAECIGELGAIEPSLQQQNFASQKQFPSTIHSDEFAIMALTELCRSYRYKNDSKYIDALSLAIQTIFKSRGVTLENKDFSNIWMAIPEKMRPLMEPLLSSNYGPTKLKIINQCPIFWTVAQNTSDWALKWSAKIINSINDENTRIFLERIRPSMKQNQYTISLFLPYIVLHTLKNVGDSYVSTREEFQSIFDIVLGKSTNKEKSQDSHKHLFVKSFDFEPKPISTSSSENVMKTAGIKAAKVVFDILDFLENYYRTYPQSSEQCNHKTFLDSLSLFEMAEVSYECGDYARAMVYLETLMKKGEGELFQENLTFLTKIYAKLENSDAVEGIQKLKNTEWSLTEKVMVNSTIGNFQDSAVCFERMMQVGDAKIEHIHMMINSYLSLDQPETALLVYENMMRKFNKVHQNHLSDEIKAEPLWRLSRFDELKELLADPVVQESTSWGVKCGQLLLKFRKDDGEKFTSELCNARLALMKNLKISGNEQAAFCRSYREIINLHLVSEFEKAGKAVADIKGNPEKDPSSVIKSMIDDWSKRMEVVQKKAAIEEPMFCFHRIILNETKAKLQNILKGDIKARINSLIDGEVGNLWIKSAKLACKNKMYQQAQTYILNAEGYQPKDLFIVKAKLHWIKNDQNNAFKTLELGTEKLLNGRRVEQLEINEQKIYSKGKLMIANYNAEAVNVEFEKNKELFLGARVKGVETEKLFLLMAEYMDRHFCSESENESPFNCYSKPKIMKPVMTAYARSMYHGSEYVFQSMPRFLSIWLDTTATCYESKEHTADIASMNKCVETVAADINVYFFYTAFSQLLSRICHPSGDVFAVLKTILVKLIKNFPQQSMWFFIPMLKSSDNFRVKRCTEILQDKRINDRETNLLVKEFNLVIEKFIELANKNPSSKGENVMAVDDSLTELMRTKQSDIIMPFQCNLHLARTTQTRAFKFADSLVSIVKVEKKVEVMPSLQRPKKVTLIGSDGKKFVMLFKSKDDLRIDRRFMEFSNVLKEFLHKDPESRHRQLSPRTYSVIPLNENAGLIEWVPNLLTYKSAIFSQYKLKRYKVPSVEELGKLNIEKLSTPEQVKIYRHLMQRYYPALGDFYRQQFATPQAFYNARSAFIRSTAIMSIIGYIMGLGDRHGENILLDVLSGESIHVDCNMLFNKGEELAVPELVPFRLTHNMTDAMGILGIEGPFKKNCEIILRVLQREKKTLMSYLRPWVYEPLVKKNDYKYRDAKADKSERKEQSAIDRIKKIEMRLKGIVKKYKGSSVIALSTEGQVNFIIEEATNEENLAPMFKGWMPWL